MTHERDPFPDQVKHALDMDVEAMAPGELARLSALRSTAMDALASCRPSPFRSVLQAMPGPLAFSGMAAAAALLVAVHLGIRSPGLPQDELLATDLDIITAEDSLELYDNLDFYTWLAEMEEDEG